METHIDFNECRVFEAESRVVVCLKQRETV